MRELRGKSAIVTGASRGIGAATAAELARLGVQVVLAARTESQIKDNADKIRQAGGSAEARAVDVTRYRDVADLVDFCVSRFGGLDFMINNAGVIEPIARLAESDPEAWGMAADINYKGVYHGLRAAIPVMLRQGGGMQGGGMQGGGVIVNVSSGAAVGALEGWSHYCSAKAGALSLTRCADVEYGDKGIRVVGLSPGTVATDMQVQIKASGINPVSRLDPSVHIGPDWPARAIAFLCSDAASDLRGMDFSIKDDTSRRRAGLID